MRFVKFLEVCSIFFKDCSFTTFYFFTLLFVGYLYDLKIRPDIFISDFYSLDFFCGLYIVMCFISSLLYLFIEIMISYLKKKMGG